MGLVVDRIYDLCREGISLPSITRRMKLTVGAVRQAIVDDQPDWMLSITESLPPSDLKDLQDIRCSLGVIARLFDIPEWQLRAYVIALPEMFDDCTYVHKDRHMAPADLLDRIPGSTEVLERLSNGGQRQGCTRCDILEEPANPLEDGICLWCRVEKAGWTLLEWHEEGCPEI